MKRGGQLARRTVLVARVPLQRGAGLARSGLASTTRVARKPLAKVTRNTGPSKAVRALVLERDRGLCVHCGAPATDCHHRRPRGSGGGSDPSINSPANLISLCRKSHEWVENNRIEAEALGFIVRHGVTDPAEVAVWAFTPWPLASSRHAWILLTHNGGKEREVA